MERQLQSKNLIFCAYAYDENMKTGVNISSSNTMSLYLKNAVVALISAKKTNPDCDVALVTNVEIPATFQDIFQRNSIIIYNEVFDLFRFGADYKWGLAFYKLCALKKMIDKGYAKYLLMDTDVFVQSSLDDMWDETKDNIMLYDINHRLSNKECKSFNDEVNDFCGEQRALTHYGGEFIAGNLQLFTSFIIESEEVYQKMLHDNFRTYFGDEFIIKIVADRLRANVKNSAAYVCRFWTGTFYLVSTCYKFNAVSVLHVPAEKERGMLKLFKYFVKHQAFPSEKKVHKILHLSGKSISTIIKSKIRKLRS